MRAQPIHSKPAVPAEDAEVWNASRYVPGSGRGHYESWFQRANHPTRPLAFWIRYTIFAPAGRPDDAEGELWACWFDGEAGTVVAAKRELPMADCQFARSGLSARIGDSALDARGLRGAVEGGGQRLGWDLAFTGDEPPLLTFDRALYGTPIPKAKALVGVPNAVFTGHVEVNGERVEIDGWVGSQNHNWGSQHTDRYAWGQVAGFDGEPGSFLEVGTGYLKLGPIWTPPMTVMTVRLDGREHRLGSIRQSLRASGSYDFFHWRFESSTGEVSVAGTIAAAPETFVGLPYRNPPGGVKTCLNSKIARCDLTVRVAGGAPRTITSRCRAAFEILTEATDHGVPVMALSDGRGGLARGPR